MIDIKKQNSSELKSDFNLGSKLYSYVAIYQDMDKLSEDINKYKNLDYSIIFVGTCAYIIKKEDYNNQFYLGISNDEQLYVGTSSSMTTKIPKPVLTNVNQNELVIPEGMSSYLNNYIGNPNQYAFITEDSTIVFLDGLLKSGEYILRYEDINGNPLNNFDAIGKITV